MPSWVFRGSKSFSRGYFVGPKFFSWVLHGLKIFIAGICGCGISSLKYFVGPIFFLVVDFVIQTFSVAVTKTVIQRYISNHVFFSKSIPTIVSCLY